VEDVLNNIFLEPALMERPMISKRLLR